MSRSAKALTALGFGYARYALAIVSGLVLLPLILATVDHALYGRWLVTVEVLSYLGFAELGVATLMPWLVAERDGRGDPAALRLLVADARGCCWLSVAVYLLVFVGLWRFAPSVIGLDRGLQSSLGMSVLLVVAATAISFFGRLHLGVLEGLQDYVFLGSLMLAQTAAGLAATIVLLLCRAGPVALAVGLLLPSLVGSVVATWRLWRRDAGLLIGLPRPSWQGMARLAAESGATWMGGIGGRLTLGSNSLLVAGAGGSPLDVVRFTATAKLGELLMQQSWMVSDSGLVGLAQLWGQGRRDRVRELTLLMLRFILMASGAVLIVVLGFNAAFVTLWVGADRFGGPALNAALSVSILGLSLVHILSVTVAVLGRRIVIGSTNLVCGILFAMLALVLGRSFGPAGVALSNAIVALFLAAPVLAAFARLINDIPLREVGRAVFIVWLPRATGPLIVAAAVGFSPLGSQAPLAGVVTASALMMYLALMRPLLTDLPLPLRLRQWAQRLRIIATSPA